MLFFTYGVKGGIRATNILIRKKKITKKQKDDIKGIRMEYKAKIADKDVMHQDKLSKLSNRVPPEEIQLAVEQLNKEFAEEKKALEEEMETKVESVRNKQG